MSKIGNFNLALGEFTVAATGITDQRQLFALAEIFFEDSFEVAYALQQYNPAKYRGMSYTDITRQLGQVGL